MREVSDAMADGQAKRQRRGSARDAGRARAAVGGGIGTLVLVLLAMYFGVDPSVILQGTDPATRGPRERSATAGRRRSDA